MISNDKAFKKKTRFARANSFLSLLNLNRSMDSRGTESVRRIMPNGRGLALERRNPKSSNLRKKRDQACFAS